MFGRRVPGLRLIILALVLLAQVYLFVRMRRVILSSSRSDRFKTRAIGLVGAAIGLLFVLNAYLAFTYIPWVYPPLAAQIGLFYPVAAWNFGSLFSALLLFLTRVAGRLWRMAGRTARASVNPGRRRFLQSGVGGLAAVPILLSGYGAAYAGIYMNREEMRCYADQVIALRPDLFVLTGDFISNSMLFLPGCVEEMARVRARYGTFATLGNHEHMWGTPGEIPAIFRQHRIPLLTNAHTVIRTEQGPFAVAGIDDLVAGQPDIEAALLGLDPSIPTLLLSHRPEIFPQAAARGIPLTLSGHYHGGQVKLSLPGGDLSLAHLWTPYPVGLYRIDASHLYVSRGIGTTFTPVRLNAPPEVTLFHLT